MTDIVKVKQGGTISNTLECRGRKPEVLKGEKGTQVHKVQKEIKETLVRKVQQDKMQQRQTLQPQ